MGLTEVTNDSANAVEPTLYVPLRRQFMGQFLHLHNSTINLNLSNVSWVNPIINHPFIALYTKYCNFYHNCCYVDEVIV